MTETTKRKLAPVRVRSAFAGAATDRLKASWKATNQPVDVELASALPLLRARSRELARNNPMFKRWISLQKSNIVGHKGFNVQFRGKRPDGTLDEDDNRALESAYSKWSLSVDVTGRLRRVDLENLYIENCARDGEFLAMMHTGNHNADRFAVQVLDPELLDNRLDYTYKRNGNRVRLGIEINDFGRPVAYHVKQTKASPLTYYEGGVNLMRIDASRIIHKFLVERPDQNRGIPWASAVMADLQNLSGYTTAAVTEKRVASGKMGFITRNAEGMGFSGEDLEDEEQLTMDAEPGTIEELPFGAGFTSWDPKTDESFKEFVNTIDQHLASGFGINYPTLANNYGDVNFSSIRAARAEDCELWKSLQEFVIDGLCRPLATEWLRHNLLYNAANNIPLSRLEKYSEIDFIGRRWEAIQPKDDAETFQLLMSMGATTLEQHWREKGLDPEEQWTKVEESRARMKSLGLLTEPKPQEPTDDGTQADT